jgi:hypothetical protein
MSIENNEVMALAKLSRAELNKFNALLEVLVQNNFVLTKKSDEDLLFNMNELDQNLPLIRTTYLSQMIEPLRTMEKLILQLITEHPDHAYRLQLYKNVNAINEFFKRFKLPDELALSTADSANSDEDSRSLYARVLNPNHRDQATNSVIRKMVKTAKSNGESSQEWKTLADGLLDSYEGKIAPVDSSGQAMSELFLAAANRLDERERKYNQSKQRLQELSKRDEPLDSRKQAKKKLNQLLDYVATDILRSND